MRLYTHAHIRTHSPTHAIACTRTHIHSSTKNNIHQARVLHINTQKTNQQTTKHPEDTHVRIPWYGCSDYTHWLRFRLWVFVREWRLGLGWSYIWQDWHQLFTDRDLYGNSDFLCSNSLIRGGIIRVQSCVTGRSIYIGVSVGAAGYFLVLLVRCVSVWSLGSRGQISI